MKKIMMKIKRWLGNRNGVDELASLTGVLSCLLYLTGTLTRIEVLGLMSAVLLIYSMFRIFSDRSDKRREENQKLLEARWKLINKLNKRKSRLTSRRQYKYFKCPECRQTLRIPRGKGKVDVTCPKCGKVFEKRS